MPSNTYLLNDQEMKDFVRNGYIKLQPDYPTELNQKIFMDIEQMFDNTGNLGNNILPLIPEIQEIFKHPLAHGALTSILGPDYVMHSHRFCHLNSSRSRGQSFHRDSYEGDISASNHRCRWAMAFYYPQNTPRSVGPTAILPRSQYYETNQAANRQVELPLLGQAGTLTIVHYDLWHRAMPNLSSHNRYMLKFLFYRLKDPDIPTWKSEQNDCLHLIETEVPNSEEQPMWQKIWHWYMGKPKIQTRDLNNRDLSNLVSQLSDELEVNRLQSAYMLGTAGEKAVPKLVDQLSDKSVAPYATLALGAGDETAIPALGSALNHPEDVVRAQAARALGDLGYPSAITELAKLLFDITPTVRRNAAEAIGNLSSRSSVNENLQFLRGQAEALGQLLQDDLYWIRDNAARSLAKMGRAAEPALHNLKLALDDQNRYVRSNAAIALKQIASCEAHRILLDNLFAARWCPLTTKESPF